MGFDFFEPRMLSMWSTDGKAMGEFPLLYYLTALGYKVFGEHEFILRLINIIIVSIGLFYLYKLLIKLEFDVFYSMALTFFFFSSTVLIYYTNNYLPDAPAFGITLTAWYFFYTGLKNQRNHKSFYLSIFLFTLASLLKVTYGLNLAAAFLSITIFHYSKDKFSSIKNSIPLYVSFLVAATIILCWYIYVIEYNNRNNSVYFLTHLTPIWDLDKAQIELVWNYIYNYWYTSYYYETTFHTFIIIVLLGFIFPKKMNRTFLVLTLSILLGTTLYAIMFYRQFMAHDYYFIAILPALIFLVINSFIAINNQFPLIIKNIFTKLGILIIILLSINYAQEKLQSRYEISGDIFAEIGNQLDGSDKMLDSINISKGAKFLVIGDHTPNGSLYFLNRRGWTLKDTSNYTRIRAKECLDFGADYLLLTNEVFNTNEFLSNINKDFVAEYNNAVIYKIEK